MKAGKIVEWLRSLALSSVKHERRGILRFSDYGDYEHCLQWVKRSLPDDQNDHPIRHLSSVQGLSCPLHEIPPSIRSQLYWEEDLSIRMQALPVGSLVTEKGIPWGVNHIQAPKAWNRTTGYQVKIGVIDTGVDFTHPDLRGSLKPGINLLHRFALPQDDNGHGTHITGTIAAANELHGMIGVAPRSIVYPVKAFDHNGTAFVSDIILGIEWCVQHGIDIVNMSFGMKTRSKALLHAVNYAYRSGVLVVASSGNDGNIGNIDFPARFSQTIAVGASNQQRRIASFTNRSRLIDIYAPGEHIVSAWLRGKYREMSGTSMATSHVTGAIALLLALKPGLTPSQIKAVIKKSARPLRSSKAPRMTGELNVTRMLKAAEHL